LNVTAGLNLALSILSLDGGGWCNFSRVGTKQESLLRVDFTRSLCRWAVGECALFAQLRRRGMSRIDVKRT
jgi:hypothetical protein